MPKCGNTEFTGEQRVFDTWFDSSISPLYILKYSRDEEFFKKILYVHLGSGKRDNQDVAVLYITKRLSIDGKMHISRCMDTSSYR